MSYNSNFTTAGIKLNIDMKDAFKDVKDTSSFLDKRLNEMSLSAENFSARWGSMTKGIKDTKRIVSGIVISRSFYTLAETMTGIAGEVFEFSRNMETAAISMEYFIKNADKSVNAAAKSQAYLLEINEFAARTPFTTETTLNLSRYIQTMGLGIETTRSFFTVMADAASATGGTEDQLNRAVIAMGRMKAKGRITAREIRQLAAANIPIYQILQDELGLTGEQVANLGESWVAADKAIVAILRGLEKRYKGAADRVSETVTGMFNTVADNMKIIGEIGTTELYAGFVTKLGTLRDALESYREVATEGGSGALFNQMLIDLDSSGAVGTRILMLVGTFKSLASTLKETYISAQPLRTLLGTTIYASVMALSHGLIAMSKIVTVVSDNFQKLGITGEVLGGILASLVITYKVGGWLAFLGQAASAASWGLINTAKGASMMLPAFMQARVGVIALTAGMAGLLVYALATKGVFDMISGSLSGLNTSSTNGSGLPDSYMSEYDAYAAKFKEYNDKIKEYSDSFSSPYTELDSGALDAVDGLEDVEKASGKAAKAVKNDWLAAFDEVYAIPKDVASGAGALGDLPKLDMGLSLLPPKFNFPSFEGAKLELPEFSLDGVFDNTIWDPNTTDLVTNESLRKLLPFAAAMLMYKFAAAFSKQPLFGKTPPTGAPGGIGAKSAAGIAGMAAKDAIDELKKLRLAIDERMKIANKLLKALDDPSLDMIATERYLEMLDGTTKKLIADVEAANKLNLIGGNKGNLILEELTKVITAADAKRLEATKSIINMMEDEVKAGTNIKPLNDIAAKLDKLYKVTAEIEAKNITPKSLADTIDAVNKKNTGISSSIADKVSDKVLLDMLNDFNRDSKSLFALVEKLGPGVVSSEQQIILDEIRAIQSSTLEVEKRLVHIDKTTAQMNRLREQVKFYDAADKITYAPETGILNREIDELATTAREARKDIAKFKTSIQASSDAVRTRLQFEADERNAAKKLVADKEAFEKRIRDNEIEAQRKEVKERLEAEKKYRDKQNKIAAAERAKARQVEAAQAYEVQQMVIAERVKEIELSKQLMQEQLKSIKDVFMTTDGKNATKAQLREMAKQFGIEVAKGDKNIEGAYIKQITKLENELKKLNAKLEDITGNVAKTINTDELMLKTFKEYIRDSVPDITKDALPSRTTKRPITAAMKELDTLYVGLADALKTSGTKLLTLTNGLNEYGTSIPELTADILKKYGSDALDSLTSRSSSPFMQTIQALGVQLEDGIGTLFSERLDNGFKLLRGGKGTSLSSVEGFLNVQIDTFIKDKIGGLFTTDIKTISGPMRETLFGDEVGLTLDKIAKYRKEWFYQFAAQVQALTDGAGGKMGVITLNRDFDFGAIIARRFHEAFNVGEIGKVFSIDAIHKATIGKYGDEAVAAYLDKLFTNVFKDPITGTIDISPLFEAMDHGVVTYSKKALKAFEMLDTAASYEKYVNMLAPLIGTSNLGEFLHTYVAIETSMGQMIQAVNFANIPRIYTKASKSLNKWLQTILDDSSIKTTRSLNSPDRMLQGFIDRAINEFNNTLDLNKFSKSMLTLKKDLDLLGDIAAGALEETALDNLSTDLAYITESLEGTTGDFRLLSKAIESIVDAPNGVKNIGRTIRAVLEQTNSINLRIAEGIEITSNELFGVTENIRKIVDTFGLGTDKVFRDVLIQLSDMSQSINKVGKAAVLEVSQQLALPIKTLGIKETIGYAANDISIGIRNAFDPLINAKGSVEAATKAWDEFLGQISDIDIKRVPKIDTSMARLEGAFKRLIIDVEATSLSMQDAMLTQVAIKDITPGGSGEEFVSYINRGEEVNAKMLKLMQSIIDVNEKQADTKFYLKKVAKISEDIFDNNKSIEGIIREMKAAPKADPRILRLAEKLTEIAANTVDRADIIKQAEYWSRLTDVSKEWLNVTVEQLNAGKTLSEAADKLAAMTGGSPAEFVGHNIFQYDIPVLESIKEFANIDFSHFVDTLQVARSVFASSNFNTFSKSLGNLYTAMVGGSTAGAHDAGVDIRMTEQIFNMFESGIAEGVAKTIDAAISSGVNLDKGKIGEIFQAASVATNSTEAMNKAIQAVNEIIEAAGVLGSVNSSKLVEAAETFGRLTENFAAVTKIKDVKIQAIDETVGIVPQFTKLTDMFKNFFKTETNFNAAGGYARASTIGGDKFSVGKATLGMTGPDGEAMDGAAKFFAKFKTKADDYKLFSVDASKVGSVLNGLAILGRATSVIGELSDSVDMRRAYNEMTTGFAMDKQLSQYTDFSGKLVEPGKRVRPDSDLMPDFAPINKDMTTLFDRAITGWTFGMMGTRSGSVNTAKKYFDLPDELKAFYGNEYFAKDTDWRDGALGGALMGRGTTGETYTQSVLTRKPGLVGSKKIKESEAEQWLQSQIGSGSPFEAVMDYFITSGDTTSENSKLFYDKYGAYIDTIIKPAYGMGADWNESANTLISGMGSQINAALESAGYKGVKSASDIDVSMKPYFDAILNEVYKSVTEPALAQLALVDRHTTGTDMMTGDTSRVFESINLKDFNNGVANLLTDELGITISKINEQFGKVSIDSDKINDNLAGWTQRLPEGLDFSGSTLSSNDISVLAAAGIQINSNGTVTFMKAMNEAMAGTSRDINLTIDDVSKDILTKLNASGVNLSFGADGIPTLDLGTAKLSEQMTSALFKLNKDLTGQVSTDMKDALSGLGEVLDSGYIQINNKSVLNGEMTIAQYIDSMGDAANKLSPELLKTLLALDDVIAQGGDVTRESIATWADGVVMPSPINKEAMTQELQEAFASIGISFIESGGEFLMVVNKLGDDIKDGMTLIPKEIWDGLNTDVVEGLRSMGVTITEEGGYVKVNLNTVLKELVDAEAVTPEIAAGMEIIGASFVVEGGKVVGAVDAMGRDLTENLLTIPTRIFEQVDPAVITALEGMGVNINETSGKVMLDFQGITETGIQGLVELYVNRPDLWDQIPQQFMDILTEANMINNEGMLTIRSDMLTGLIQIGEDWVGSWSKLPVETQRALGLTFTETEEGLFRVTKAAADAKVGEAIDGSVILPFEKLPQELKDKLTGPGGADEAMKLSLVQVSKTTSANLVPMNSAITTAFGKAATDAGNGASDIAKAVSDAMRDIATLNNVEIDNQSLGSKIKNKVTKTPVSATQKSDGTWTVTGGGKTYGSIRAKDKYSAIEVARRKAAESGLPSFKTGGLISSDGIYRAGEFGRTEAVLPLEDPSAMAQVGAAIAAHMPYSAVTELSGATIAMLVGKFQNTFTTEREKTEVYNKDLFSELLVGIGAYSDKMLEQMLTANAFTSAINALSSEMAGALKGIESIIDNSNDYVLSAIDNAASDITSAINSIDISVAAPGGYDDIDTSGVTVSDSGRPGSSNSNSSTNPLGMSISDFNRYLVIKEAAEYQHSVTGKWNSDLGSQAQALRDQYGVTSDSYAYDDLKKYKGSARGSIVNKDALYRAGEGGLNEAIIPLEKREVLKKVGTAIASAMPRDIAAPLSQVRGLRDGGVRRQSDYRQEEVQSASIDEMTQRVLEVVLPAMANARSTSSGDGDKRPLYVGTLIADERGLKELNKKLDLIEAQEKVRRG